MAQFVENGVSDVMPVVMRLVAQCSTYKEFRTRHNDYYTWLRSNGRLKAIKALLPVGKAGQKNLGDNHRKARRRKWRNKPENKLALNLRTRLWFALKGRAKFESALALIGCSISELKVHLQAQFKPGMTWDNYGEWHVDHKRPCSLFNLSVPSEQRRCFHYTNLQPLWAAENLHKGSRFIL